MNPVFKNKVVVITGGASGIGEALGYQFGKNGARIGLLDNDAQRVHDASKAMRSKKIQTLAIKCDVTHEADCQNAIDNVIDTYGDIDVLINNAGITLRAPFTQTTPETYRKVMDVNFFGALHCTKAATESLIKQKGMVIIISSIAGFSPLPGRSGYCASKYALHGLFETVQLEMRPLGVHVLLVCPAFVKTNLQTRALGGDGKVTSRVQSIAGKPVTAEETALQIYNAAKRRKNRLVPTTMGKWAYWINRIAPDLYAHIVSRQFKSEFIC